ncbi:unnamed protein product [Caenorhabditis sp. 36 PRJEB53466]|nr:unnamed protein product [Caenorhabditis sp. 36 PRJEB53466]
MSDAEFDSFDFGEDTAPETSVQPDDDDEENREQRRDLSMAMTQKLYGTQARGAVSHVDYDTNDYVEPRNRFEEIMKDEHVRIANDTESYEKFVVFGQNLNHEEFTRNLEKRLTKNRNLFDDFVAACHDSNNFSLYLSPSKSKLGQQDTIFRAFLQIRATQTRAFDLLLQKLNVHARKTEQSEQFLAQTCVAHMRYLNRLFEPLAVFNTIFEFPFRLWGAEVRNDLISALPEIFIEHSLQQATAIRLDEEIHETQNILDLPSFQLTIVETLRLLRIDPAIGRQIRMHLVRMCADLDVSCLPSLVAFSLHSLLTGSSKSDEEERNFHEMLREMAKTLKVEVIRKKTGKVDTLVFEIYAHFSKFLQLEKKGWKHVTSYINRNKKDVNVKEEVADAAEDAPEDQENEESESAKWMNSFETMLILSLLSASDTCPQSFVTVVNSRMLNLPSAVSSKFLKLIDLIISFKKFASAHLSSLIHVARHSVWSPDPNVRQMGVSIWKQLFVGMEKKDRSKVFEELMKHFTHGELECEAVLDVFSKVIK